MAKKNNVIMSATRMSMFLQCKWKYWCNYILHIPKRFNPSFRLGIAAHEALAAAGKIWMEKEKFTKTDVKKITNVYAKTAAKEGVADGGIYDDGLQMVLNRLNDFEVGKILLVEDEFKIATDDGVMVMGAMDKVIELNEETLLVVDYKTSKYSYTSSELKSDIQLSLYDLVASLRFPEYKRIILCLDYLRDVPLYTYRTAKERESFAKFLLAVYNEIMKLSERKAKPALNEFCSWCDFADNCPAYEEAISNDNVPNKKLLGLGDEDLVREYLNIKNRKRALDGQERKMRDFILRKIKSEEKELTGEDKVLYARQSGFTVYDPRTVYEAVGLEDFLDMVNISKERADGYMADNPGARPLIESTAVKNYRAPFLASKKVR